MKRNMIGFYSLRAIALVAVLQCAFDVQAQVGVSGTPISAPYSIDAVVQPRLWDVGQSIPVSLKCRVQGGKPATIETAVQPWVKVIAGSSAANLEVHPTMMNLATGGSTEASIQGSVLVKDAGEFIVCFKIMDGAGAARGSQSLFVISRGGKISISGSDFRICEWQFLMDRHGLALDTKVNDLPADKKQEVQDEYKAIRRDRRVKEENYDELHGQNQQQAAPSAAADGTKSAKKSFKAFWTAPNSKKLSIVAAKVEVLDFTTDAVLIPAGNLALGGKYSDNLEAGGVYEFDDPGVDYKVRITPKYEGGTVGGSAVGTYDPFEVVDSAGGAYDEDFVSGKNEVEYTAPKAQAGDTGAARRSGVWNVYHAVLDVAKGAKDLHSMEKGSSYSVYFPSAKDDEAYYSPSTKDVYIGWNSRNDWDTLGHEYSHLLDDKYDIVSSSPGGGHYINENAYSSTFSGNNTAGDKGKSLRLAISEAFASWFGVHVTALSPYKGLIDQVGDEKYKDWYSLEDGPGGSYATTGEDSELAVQRLMWDWADSANNESRTVSGVTVKDKLSLGHTSLLNAMKSKNLSGIHELWRSKFLPGGDVTKLNQQAADAAETLVFFGVSPVLTDPKQNAALDLNASPPNFKFKWVKNQHTGSTDLDTKDYRLLLFNSDYSKVLLDKQWLGNVLQYDLTDADVQTVTNAMGTTISDIKAVVFGRNTLAPETGPYPGNVVDIRVQGANRFVVMVVDSSGSMTTTDPNDRRKDAAKETIRRLVSQAEAQAQKTVPDRAAAIDFDYYVTVLSDFADPPVVEPTIDRVDSSGNTRIDLGIDTAVSLLENAKVNGLSAFISGKAVICVFTDGDNNAGPAPVIWAIANAISKGIRVHYGFLKPLIKGSSVGTEPGGGTSGTSTKGDPPYPTIQEAVLASGGIYGEIGDAESQIAFVDQMYRAGLTGSDPADSGSIVGQVNIAGRIDDPLKEANYYFAGQVGEQVKITVTGVDFDPEIYLVDRTGAFIGVDKNYEGDRIAEIALDLPYTGMYNVKIFPKGGGVGRFNIFVDVQNPTSGIVEDVTAYTTVAFTSWVLDRASGAMVGQLVLSNNTLSPKILKDAFWYALPDTTNSRLAYVDGTTPAGVPYVDITARILAQLASVGNGDANLDPGEQVVIGGIAIFSRDLSPPQGTLYSLWADPPQAGDPGICVERRQTDGFTKLRLQGRARTICAVEASEDLVHWKTVYMTMNETGAVEFIDRQAPQRSQRFYRVRSP